MIPNERSSRWLRERLEYVRSHYYPEISGDDILIRFGQKARARLGSIKRRNNISHITITGYFRDTAIPECVIDETISHELAHYIHGFESPLPQLYRFPHEGSIVKNELFKRGLGKIHLESRRWLKGHWRSIVGVRPRRKRTWRQLLTARNLLKWH